MRLLSVLIDLTKEGMNRSNCLLTNPMIGQAGVKQERIALSQKLSALLRSGPIMGSHIIVGSVVLLEQLRNY